MICILHYTSRGLDCKMQTISTPLHMEAMAVLRWFPPNHNCKTLETSCGFLRSFYQIFENTLYSPFQNMRTYVHIHPPHHLFSLRTAPISWIQLRSPRQLLICQAKFETEYGIDGSSHSFTTIPSTLLVAEKEEAKAILSLFLRKQGLSNAVAARTINKSDDFITHLISKLHSVHKSRYLVGRELTTLEIREALVPYLESLLEEHGNVLVDVVENFPSPPLKERPISPPPIDAGLSSKKLKAIARVSEVGSTGQLPPHVNYLLDVGLSLDQIKGMTRRFPAFAYYSLDGKIKPVVEFLLEIGVPRSDIPHILFKRPQLCGISLAENFKPTMTYLENLGIDKSKWAKVINRFPALLTYSRQKVKALVDYLVEQGLSAENIGKVLTRCPNIVSYSVDDKLRPTSDYFRSMGVDVSVLLYRSPQTFGLSIEANLKPVTEFFLGRGYDMDDIGTMVSRYGALYTFSLVENLVPKWDFFLTLDYPKSELIKFPQYFGYSLEERIKPRYEQVRKCGVQLFLNQVLSVSESNFQKALERKMKKMLEEQVSSSDTNFEVQRIRSSTEDLKL